MTKTELLKSIYFSKSKFPVIYGSGERLYSCSAEIIYAPLENCLTGEVRYFYFLKSYSTIVALYNEYNGGVYIFDYSATTSKHCSKFINWLRENNLVVNTATYLYQRSDRICRKYFCYTPKPEVMKINKEILNEEFGLFIEEIWE